MANNFLTGAANALSQGLEQSNMSKLQLAMLSKRIEMEQAAKEKEMTFAHELGTGTPEQLGALVGLAKGQLSPEQQDSLKKVFPNGISADVRKDVLSAIGVGNKIPQFSTIDAGVDQYGNKLKSVFNKKTGAIGTATPTGGYDTTASEDISKVRQSAQEMRGVVGLVDNQIKKLTIAAGAYGLPEQIAKNKIAQYLQNDKGAMKAYIDTIASHNQRFEYMLSRNPRVPHEIIQQAAGQWFNPMTDIGATWEQKKQNLLNLINNTETSGLAAHGLQPIGSQPATTQVQPQVNQMQALSDALDASMRRRKQVGAALNPPKQPQGK